MIYDDLIRELETQHQRDDEMTTKTERLLQDAASTIRDIRTAWDNKCTEVVDLRAKLASAKEIIRSFLPAAILDDTKKRAIVFLTDENSK